MASPCLKNYRLNSTSSALPAPQNRVQPFHDVRDSINQGSFQSLKKLPFLRFFRTVVNLGPHTSGWDEAAPSSLGVEDTLAESLKPRVTSPLTVLRSICPVPEPSLPVSLPVIA